MEIALLETNMALIIFLNLPLVEHLAESLVEKVLGKQRSSKGSA